jgi:hypothetical protein
MKLLSLVLILIFASVASVSAGSRFDELKSLAGDWNGQDD